MLTEFDYAVINYAEQRGEPSEAVYSRLDAMEPQGYRDQKTEAQLMDKLNRLMERETVVYHLPYDIVIKVNGNSGSITSSLKDNPNGFDFGDDPSDFNLAVDTLESFILAQACAGIDVMSKAYQESVMTTVEALINHCT